MLACSFLSSVWAWAMSFYNPATSVFKASMVAWEADPYDRAFWTCASTLVYLDLRESTACEREVSASVFAEISE